MKFGYILPNYGDKIAARDLLELSKTCEEEGFDSVWATDHVIMPTEHREPYGQVMEPLVTLSYIASATTKLRVGTSCVVLPQRNPILLAKQAAVLDVFSQGRVILGLGAGWVEKEFGFLNADFRTRGRVMDESIRLMKALWREDIVNFEGGYFHVEDAVFLPKPVRKDIPVWIGGNGPTAVRRAARLGDGWHPVGPDLAGFAEGVRKIEQSERELTVSVRMTTDVRKKREDYVGANNEKRVAVSGSSEEIRRAIGAYADAGLDYYCASINHPDPGDIILDLKKFASEVVRSFS